MAELLGALRANRILPFANYHRLHVVPPCIITPEEAEEGLAAIDKALTAISAHYTG
jgi:taurine--2-oxoglutarate transaminase